MAPRGPAKTPSVLVHLRGNPGKRPLNLEEPKPEIRIPPPPKELVPAAKREWRRITPELRRLGLLSDLDRAALAAYCQHYAVFMEACQHVQKEGVFVKPEGETVPVQNPWFLVMRQEGEAVRKILAEFGLSPASRTRVKATGNAPDADAMEDVLNHGKPDAA